MPSRPQPESSDANISKISIGGGVAGLIFTIGVVAMFVLALPPARWFFLGSMVLGLIVAVVLKCTARDR